MYLGKKTPLFYKPDDDPIRAETCRLVDSCTNIDNCTTLLCNDGITKSFITSNNTSTQRDGKHPV